MSQAYERAKMIQERNTFALHNAIELESADENCVVMRLEINDKSKNPLGIVHGGAMYTMADCAAGIVVNTDGRRHVTQGSSMHYLKNRTEGVIRAAGRVVHRGKTTSLVHVEITDEGGVLLASGEFTFFCLDANK